MKVLSKDLKRTQVNLLLVVRVTDRMRHEMVKVRHYSNKFGEKTKDDPTRGGLHLSDADYDTRK